MSFITVLGAGNYGTTLANIAAGNGCQVKLWTVEEEVFQDIKANRENAKYLPDVILSEKIEVYMDLKESLLDAEIIIMAVPSHVVREVIQQVAPLIRDSEEKIIVDIAKGLEPETFLRMSEVIEEELKKNGADRHHIVALSGPSIARELSRGTPTSVMIATKEKNHAWKVKKYFESDIFNIYITEDVIGLELGGVFKNIIALLIGMCDGANLGINTKAALMVALLDEIRELGGALGAQKSTFYGLAGLGDIIATSMSPASRNHTLGVELGKGRSLEEAQKGMVMVTEGVAATKVACQAAAKLGVEIPLIRKVNGILFEGLMLKDLIDFFMSGDYDKIA